MFEFLSDLGRRVWQYISRAVRERLSTSYVWKTIRRIAEEYDYKRFLRDIRQMQIWEEKWKAANRVPFERELPEELYAPAKRIIKNPYEHVLRIRAVHRETGEPTEFYMTFGSWKRLSRKEIDEHLHENWSHIQERYELREYEYAGFQIEQLRKSPVI